LYAAQHLVVLDPTVPPLVSLSFEHRTALLVEILDGTGPDQLAFFAFGALAFLAYHTAGHLHLADAVRSGHPGMTAIGFPQPDADDLWRFPTFSYRRALARRHPDTARRGNPA
jgi:enediyne biosynthesis protein E8